MIDDPRPSWRRLTPRCWPITWGVQARDDRDRRASVEEARAEFTRALQVLERTDEGTRQDPTWQLWHDEASAALREVDALI